MRRQGCAVIFLLLAGLLFQPSVSSADIGSRERLYHRYFDYPCHKFGIPKVVAMAIARQESDGNPLVINIQGKDVCPTSLDEAIGIAEACEARGLSYDVGLMQINSYWIRKYHIPLPMLFSLKNNIYMGCFILAGNIRRLGFNWKGIAAYHSMTPWRNADYQEKLRRHLRGIFNDWTVGK